MKVLMTGGTGLVGKRLGQVLVQRGHELVVLSREGSKAQAKLPYPARVFKWDASSLISEAALSGVEAVIHLAGESVAARRWSEEQKKRIYDSRIQSTSMLHRSLVEHKLKVSAFISSSAVGYYGNRGDEILNELSGPRGDFLSRLCVDWEQAVWDTRDVSERQVALRTGVVLSKMGGALVELLPLFRNGIGGKLGSGQQWMSWIHLDDLVQMYVWSLENPVSGAFNAVSPEPVRNSDFTKALADAVGKPAWFAVPSFALRLAMGEMSQVLLDGQRAYSHLAQKQGFTFKHTNMRQTLVELCEAASRGDYEMLAEQWVPHQIPEVFDFFSREHNLETLTPPFLRFKVLRKSTDDIREGTLIDYTLSLYGIPFGWRTRIENWEPGRRFVDTQLKGPYAKWHHTHTFERLGEGTLMCDRVLYRLPMGLIGRMVAGHLVKRDVGRIFAFRRQTVGELFP